MHVKGNEPEYTTGEDAESSSGGVNAVARARKNRGSNPMKNATFTFEGDENECRMLRTRRLSPDRYPNCAEANDRQIGSRRPARPRQFERKIFGSDAADKTVHLPSKINAIRRDSRQRNQPIRHHPATH